VESEQEQQQRTRVEELRREIQALEGRDFQLWSIGFLVLLVVAAGFVALVWPNVMWRLGELKLDGRYVPQLVFGFVVLVVLFNIYALQQRRILRNTRDELFRQMLRSEAAERLSLVDPLTETFNRRYLDEILPKEVSRADRRGSSVTFAIIDVDGFKAVNTRFGHLVGDKVLTEVACLLKRVFRASDTVIRYGGDEFLVLMAETDEQEAEAAVTRLQSQVEVWNRTNTIVGYKMGLSCGLAAYAKGAVLTAVLEAADDRMYREKLRKYAAA
jgi:diguanylate cyclase (GGDEF)-like protein